MDEAAGIVKKWMLVALRFALGAAAMWAVARELRGVDARALSLEIASLSPGQYLLGASCTVASFLLLGVIEWLALRNGDGAAARRVPLSAALRTGFVANALSQSVGLAVLTGAAVRARAYARHGLTAIDMAQATVFVTITATLGLLAVGAVAVFTNGRAVEVGAVSLAATPTALVLGALVAVYLVWGLSGRGNGIGWRRWRIPRPTPLLAVGQVSISALDWLVTGAVLYAFMPHHFGLRLGLVLGAYLVAQVVAVTSHVPAGAGIFELVVIAILLRVDPAAPRAAVAAALVMFRVVYYLVPLCIAVIMAAMTELSRHRLRAPAIRDLVGGTPSSSSGALSPAAFDHAG
jgi:phosphatidylglycerol lysyltransferase